MEQVYISGHIPADLSLQVESLLEETGQSRDWALMQGLRHWLASEDLLARAVQKGLDDVAAGRVVAHDEVVAVIRSRSHIPVQ